MRWRRLLVAVAATGLTLLLACSDEANIVTMNGDRNFVPDAITVSSGEEITFENIGVEAHTVTAYGRRIPEGADYFASGGFRSEAAARASIAEALITEGESYAVTLEVPGSYHYVCLTHEQQGMRGSINVVD
jgi:plastocyanin